MIDDGSEKTKGKEKWIIKRTLKFVNFKNCLEATQRLILT